jgi:hypothetical protein
MTGKKGRNKEITFEIKEIDLKIKAGKREM